MTRSDDQRVADIIDAADRIGVIVTRGKEAWDRDAFSQLAVERLLEIIGEAARAMTEEGRAAYPDVAWGDVIDLRTLLAHHYHRVDPAQVWVVAVDDVPNLLAQLRK